MRERQGAGRPGCPAGCGTAGALGRYGSGPEGCGAAGAQGRYWSGPVGCGTAGMPACFATEGADGLPTCFEADNDTVRPSGLPRGRAAGRWTTSGGLFACFAAEGGETAAGESYRYRIVKSENSFALDYMLSAACQPASGGPHVCMADEFVVCVQTCIKSAKG